MWPALLAQDFIKLITLSDHFETLKKKIKLLSCEIIEKNYKHRPTTLQNLARETSD